MTEIYQRMGDYTLTEVTRFEAYTRGDGWLDFLMDEMDSLTIDHSQEESDITGKGGRVIGKKKKNKSVSVSGTNGLISEGMLKAQTGGEIKSGNMTVKKSETKKISANMTVIIDETPVGAAGQEIGKIQLLGTAGAVVKSYAQGVVASDEKFAFDPATKTITLPTDTVIEAGMNIRYAYNRTYRGTSVNNPSDKYSEVREVWFHGYGTDKCDNKIAYAWYFPRADISGEFSVDLGGDQTMHNFSFQALPDLCSELEDDLYTLYIYRNGELVAVNPGTNDPENIEAASDQEVKNIFSD
ncbi:MAG: hypothetical protein NC299_18560 [Lachnospiraceae bacterium]|nr:hypothetical protein [Ruminococcus sp.]MCM1277331.1 hypothetical protein [Lachnospiraceae bacterium]